ncbi:MAG: DUF177 domain-containing protein [Nitrospinales bacterium]
MIFEIDEIPDGGLDFKLRVERDLFEINRPDCSLNKDVEVAGTLKKIERDIYLNARAQTALALLCSRCLAAVNHAVDCKVFTRYVPGHPSKKWEKDRKLEDADLETEDYFENRINIKHALHDHILLAVPMVCLCRENCLGLCSGCGKDLNKGPCGCHPERSIDPRLEILKSLKEKSDKE